MKLLSEIPSNNSLIALCDEVLTTLRQHREAIKSFHVAALFLFGSVSRNEATTSSDIDLLVEFSQPVGMFAFARLQIYLEKLLGCAIDLGTVDSLKPYLRDRVLVEAKRVF